MTLSEKVLQARERRYKAARERYPAIIADFKQTHNLTTTGKHFFISRERVRQIIRAYGDTEATHIADGIFLKTAVALCRDCGRQFLTRRAKPLLYCSPCRQWHWRWDKKAQKPRRRYEPRGNCPKCGVAYTGHLKEVYSWRTVKRGGMCGKCYSLTDVYREAQRKWGRKQYERVKPARDAYHRAWSQRNPEKIRAYQAKGYIKNRENRLERSRQYWIKKQIGE